MCLAFLDFMQHDYQQEKEKVELWNIGSQNKSNLDL